MIIISSICTYNSNWQKRNTAFLATVTVWSAQYTFMNNFNFMLVWCVQINKWQAKINFVITPHNIYTLNDELSHQLLELSPKLFAGLRTMHWIHRQEKTRTNAHIRAQTPPINFICSEFLFLKSKLFLSLVLAWWQMQPKHNFLCRKMTKICEFNYREI